MFSYYGTKARLAGHYPAPIKDVLIEPFAGAAGYACAHAHKEVRLYDANPKIVAVWQWLIAAAPSDVLALPDLATGQRVTDYATLTDAERWLIGYCINPASTIPKVTASGRSAWNRYKKKIAAAVPTIKHWTATCASWDTIPDCDATWYVDPPYQKAGKYYFGFSALRFDDLAAWCRGRSGQVMVCENEGADWLPFRPLVVQQGMTKKQVEVIWTPFDDLL